MLLHSLNKRSTSIIHVIQRSLAVKSDFQLSNEMKMLNNKKQYRQAIALFYRNRSIDDIGKANSYVITHFLNACNEVNNIELG